MGRRIAWLIVGVAFAVSLGAAPPPPAAKPVDAKVLQALRVEAQKVSTSGWQVFQDKQGLAGTLAQLSTKTIWVWAGNVPGQANRAEAGFTAPPLSSGMQIPGVSAKATFDYHGGSGQFRWEVKVLEVGTPSPVAAASGSGVTSTIVQVTTQPFTMQAGRQYRIQGTVYAEANNGFSGPPACATMAVRALDWQI